MTLRGPRSPLARRLRSLRNWEALNVLLLPALLAGGWITRQSDVSWGVRLPPLLLVSAVLAQGAVYWHIKLRSIGDGRAFPGWFCGFYRTLRALLCLGLAGYALHLWSMVRGDVVSGWDVAWSLGLLGFSVLEYANYFWLQLKHDSSADLRYLHRHRRLRPAPLATDLERRCGSDTGGSPAP
jgi:hypothetical protein